MSPSSNAWLTDSQLAVLRALATEGPINATVSQDLIVLLSRRLVARKLFTWTITDKGRAYLDQHAS